MTKRLNELRQRKSALLTEAESLTAKVDAGTATEDEVARLDAITGDPNDPEDRGEIGKVAVEISRQERIDDERRSMPAEQSESEATAEEEGDREHRVDPQAKKPAKAFDSLGEMLCAVVHADSKHTTRDEWDPRLHDIYQPGGFNRADASGANESTPSDGGFLVQQDLIAPLVERVFQSGDLLSRVRRFGMSTNANGVRIPAVDETSRVNGSRWGGVQAYWADEADTVTATKPKLRMMDMRLNKLMAGAYATEEILQDSNLVEQYFGRAFTEEMAFKAEDGIMNGTGSGQLLGFMNSPALVTVAAESQGAATIVTNNILKMWARLPMRSRRNAVWLVNQDIEPQLYTLTLGSGTAVILLYTPPGVNGNSSPFGLLMGRPVIPVEYAATLGTSGDISLVDLDQYLMIDKGGVKMASSMHVRFLYDEQAFRWTYRIDGQPMWKSPITPYKGSNTQSPFLTLATRAG